MVIIKCKKCGSIEEHGGTTISALEVFDNNIEVIGWSCSKCVSKIEEENAQIKIENLRFWIQSKNRKLTELINLTKGKLVREIRLQLYAGELGRVIRTELDRELHNQLEILLESQKQCLQNPNISAREKLTKSKEILSKKLTSEEIENLLGKQVEINELEKKLANLQIQENLTEIPTKNY